MSQLEAAVKRDPGNPERPRRARPGVLGPERVSRAPSRRFGAPWRWDRDPPRRTTGSASRSSEKSDLPGAVAEFRKAIELDPKYGRAYTNLGSALATSGDYAEAVEVFQKALALEPNSLGAHFNLGMALREKGDLEAALLHLRQVADADPTNASIHYELGQTLRQSGDLAGAIAALEKAIEIDPELREGYYALGVALRAAERGARRSRSAARRRARPTISTSAPSEAAGRGDLAAARDAAHRGPPPGREPRGRAQPPGLRPGPAGRACRPPSPTWSARWRCGPNPPRPTTTSASRCGTAAPRTGPWPSCGRASTLDPAAGGSQAFLGTALRETGDLAGARASLQRAIALLPPTAAVYVDLGITYLRAGDLDKALGQLEAGLNLPGAVAARAGLGLGHRRPPQGARRRARAGPRRTTCWACLLGRTGRRQQRGGGRVPRGDPAPARLRRSPQQPRSRADPGRRRRRRASPRSARPCASSPDYADAHANLGAALTPTDAEEAIRELEKAVALAPTLGEGPVQPGRPPTAPVPATDRRRRSSSCGRSSSSTPTFARAHLALGKALLQDGKRRRGGRGAPGGGAARARAAGKRTISSAWRWRGRAARRKPRPSCRRAASSWRRTTATRPRASTSRRAAPRWREATSSRRRPSSATRSSSGPTPPRRRARSGTVLEKQGDADGASAAYRKALELNPADAPARAGPRAADEPAEPRPTIPDGWPSSRATFARAGSRRSSRCSPST